MEITISYDTVGFLVVGICFSVVGILMMKTGSCGLIHSYHIAHLARDRRVHVAKRAGLGCVVAGAGGLIAGAVSMVTGEVDTNAAIYIVPAAIMLVGMGIALTTIVKYTFRPWS